MRHTVLSSPVTSLELIAGFALKFTHRGNTAIWSVVAEQSSALDSSSGVVRMWVWILRMGRKAVGPVCCVMHVKELGALIVKEKGLAQVFVHATNLLYYHY